MKREDIKKFTPREKEYQVQDDEVRGLVLRVFPSGKKSWAFRYSLGDRDRRVSIGGWPELTLDQARARAAQFYGEVRNRKDPAQVVKQEKADRMTVAKLIERFTAEHVEKLRPSTQRGYKHYLDHYIKPMLGTMLLREVALADCKAVQRRASGMSARTGNYTVAVLSKLLSWAEEEGLRVPGSNPCQAIKRATEKPRQRFLTEAEIQRVWAALDEVELSPLPRAAIQLLLLTGCRHSEILRMKWSQIKDGVLTLTEHKTMARGDRVVLLSEDAQAILKQLPKHKLSKHKLSKFVFAGRGKDGTIGGSLDKAWQEVRKKAKLPGVRLHDLRHTFASMAVASGMTLEQTGQLLGHSTPATTKRYAHLVQDKARESLESIPVKRKKAPEGA